MCDLFEDECGSEIVWLVNAEDRDYNKICVNTSTKKVIKRLPTKILPNGIALDVYKTYKAILLVDKEGVTGTMHSKGDRVNVSEMPNGALFVTARESRESIENNGNIDDYKIIIDYSEIDSETLTVLIKSAAELERYEEASLMSTELKSRN